ncbi:MAG: LysR substrate-binding domain-containing protein [Anaerolineaceae bacterium]
MLDPHQLRIFLTAAETLNFSRAAELLHMSQPSVTQHIKLLETHFETPLFVRQGNRLILSETGYALVPLARDLVSLSLETDEKMDGLRKQIHGNLILACSTTPGKYILPVLLAEFMALHPNVQARCEVHPRQKALELLEQGLVHFAFSNSLDEFNENIEFKKFITDPVTLIAPLDHPLARYEEIHPDQLLSERFILREESAGTYRAVRVALAEIGMNISDLKTVLTLGNSEAIAISVQKGIGLGFVSQMVIDYMVQGKVAQVRIKGLEIFQHVYLARHRLQPFGSLQNAFWEFESREKLSP